MRSVELRKKRAKLIADAGEIITKAREAERKMSAEEREKFNKLHDDADALLVEVQDEERQETREKELAEIRGAAEDATGNRGVSNDPTENARLENETFTAWMRGGLEALTEEQRTMAASRLVDAPEGRAAQTVTTTAGGFLIAPEFQAELETALLAFGGVRNVARIVATSTGAQMEWPTVDDTAQTGELLGINVAVNEQAIAYGQVVFNAFKYSSKAVKVPVELAQDSAFDINGHVNSILAERLGRITNAHLTTGTGAGQPNGVVTAATDSTRDLDISELATGSINAFGDIRLIEHSIDPAYRAGASWMMHDTLLRDLKGVVDGNNRPIFRNASEVPGGIDSIMGYPITINQQMADSGTATNKALLFGDFSKYIVRVVRPMVMLRLVERFADNHQIGFFAFERLDGDLIDAGTNPLKWADMIA